MTDNETVIFSKLLSQKGIPHGFFTKNLGLAPPSLDAIRSKDASFAEEKAGNDRLSCYLEVLTARSLALPVQVHTSELWNLETTPLFDFLRGPEADATVSKLRNVAVGVVTADCVPILLASESGSVVSAIHGGWRGLYENILKKTVRFIENELGVPPDKLIVAIGPAIGQCCYEIDPDLAKRFTMRFDWTRQYISGDQQSPHLALPQIAQEQLLRAGIQNDRIDVLERCTKCEADRFFSYRRQGSEAGRQLSAICCPTKKR
jgi:hypothetical protein